LDINPQLEGGVLVPVASGRGHDGAISIRQRGAVLWGWRLKPGETTTVTDAPFVYLFVARGAVKLEGAGELANGDAVRLTAAGSRKLIANGTIGAEVLIWKTS
jgi:redox-sensitive bicupin YhaK (pirin superfamily)